MLCGDFNCQIDTNNKDKSVSVLKKILKTFCFKDCWLSGGKTYEQGLTWCNGDIMSLKVGSIMYLLQNSYHFQ